MTLVPVTSMEVVPWTPGKPHGFVIEMSVDPPVDITKFYSEKGRWSYAKNKARRFETEQEAQAMLLALKLSAE